MKRIGLFIVGVVAGVVGTLIYKDPNLRRKIAGGVEDFMAEMEDFIAEMEDEILYQYAEDEYDDYEEEDGEDAGDFGDINDTNI